MGEGRAGGDQLLYSSVSEPPCNRRIFHACHRLCHVPFIPCCRWRVSTSGCCVLHHCVFAFPHIPLPHLVFTRIGRRCVRVTVTVTFRSLLFLLCRETTFCIHGKAPKAPAGLRRRRPPGQCAEGARRGSVYEECAEGASRAVPLGFFLAKNASMKGKTTIFF